MFDISKVLTELQKKEKQEKSIENKLEIKEIDNILLDETVIKQIKKVVQQLIVLCNDSYNYNSQGLLFGNVDDNNSLVISTCLPFNFLEDSEENKNSFNIYLKNNRLDSLKIGHFICLDHSDFLNKKNIKYFIEFQVIPL